jgi:hypothetical protein
MKYSISDRLTLDGRLKEASIERERSKAVPPQHIRTMSPAEFKWALHQLAAASRELGKINRRIKKMLGPKKP